MKPFIDNEMDRGMIFDSISEEMGRVAFQGSKEMGRVAFQGSKEMLLLKTEDASSIRRKEEILMAKEIRQSPYTIDILIVGSKNSTEQAQTQRDTWASHEAVRHFFLSTEDDHTTDPMCSENLNSIDKVARHSRVCRSRRYWERENALNPLTRYFKLQYAQTRWLAKKKNPIGWLCAQRRFATSFTSVAQMYAETHSFPDYFIIADDDTYVNIDKIVQMLIEEPSHDLEAKKKNKTITMTTIYPSSETPLVLAGCRVRSPESMVNLTFSFGGYGTFFSKGSLQRLVQPLHCNDTNALTTEFERGVCKKLLNKSNHEYPVSATIAEEGFYERGDSVNDVFYKYSRNIPHFCLHSDWFLGYLTNFYNISQHTVPGTGDWFGNWFDGRKMNVQESRLYSIESSEIYKHPSGQCLYSKDFSKDCDANATVCHRVSIDTFRSIHSEVRSRK